VDINIEFNNYPDFSEEGEPPCVHYPPDMFFADLDDEYPVNATYITNEAKKVCYTCPYQLKCLTYAIEENLVGVWGGTSQRQRRDIIKTGKVFIPLIHLVGGVNSRNKKKVT